MFVFETLILSDDKSLQTLLRNVETELIVLALKGADEALRDKLFSCMSSRAAANIMDEDGGAWPCEIGGSARSPKTNYRCRETTFDENHCPCWSWRR